MPAVWQGLLACHCSLVAPVAAGVSPSPAGWPRRPTGAAPQPFGPHARPYEIPSVCEGAWYVLVCTRAYSILLGYVRYKEEWNYAPCAHSTVIGSQTAHAAIYVYLAGV